MVDARRATVHDLCRRQRRQTLEPQARRLDLPMTVLPRLDCLVRSASDDLPAMPMLDRILNSQQWDRRVEAGAKKPRAVFHLRPANIIPPRAFAAVKPAHAAIGEIRARRVQCCAVPAISEYVEHITLDVMRITIGGG